MKSNKNMKPAPVGSSFKTDLGSKDPSPAGGAMKLHKAGGSVPNWQAKRMDKLEAMKVGKK